jgi:hypothetical protein
MTRHKKEDKNSWKCSQITTNLHKKNKITFLGKSNSIETKAQKL